MIRIKSTLAFWLLLAVCLGWMAAQAQQKPVFTLVSPDLGGQFTEEFVYNNFGCEGQNLSPHLVWRNAPAGTKSFAITMYDPDAPTGSGWWHWLVFDIPASVTELTTGASHHDNQMPAAAIQSLTDFGTYGYGGPCPPPNDGDHRYIITVYALPETRLGLDKNATPATVGFYLNNKALAKASLLIYYGRH